MTFNVSVWVNHYDLNFDTDDVCNDTTVSTYYMAQRYDDVTSSDVRNIRDSWAYTPGFTDMDVIPR